MSFPFFAIINENNKVVLVLDSPTLNLMPINCIAIELMDGERCNSGDSYSETSSPRFISPEPQPVHRQWTAYEFLLRFTAGERAAFRAAAITDPQVADFQQLAQAAQEIRSDDPMTIAGMDYLVSVGLLSSERRAEILGA
jgi:hypothetical protein